MKRLLLASSCLLLILPDIAVAQSSPRPSPSGAHARPSGPARPGRPAARPPQARPPQARPPQARPPGNDANRPGRPGAPPVNRPPPARPPVNRPPGTRPPNTRPPNTRPPNTRPPNVRPPTAQPGRPLPRPPRPGPPHRPGAGRPPNFRPIHRPGWVYPHGWGYRRWSTGLLLPSLFLSSRYYYDSYWDVGLSPPPPGYRWVRYGPDLLLVDLRTRRIADVVYGAFL